MNFYEFPEVVDLFRTHELKIWKKTLKNRKIEEKKSKNNSPSQLIIIWFIAG